MRCKTWRRPRMDNDMIDPIDFLKPANSTKQPSSSKIPVNEFAVDDGKSNREISVRKIDNGWIVRESYYNFDGHPVATKETFSKERPGVKFES